VGGWHPYIYIPLWMPRPCGSTTIAALMNQPT
jgi:hypothetical protein